jgi:hypothetical protein
MLAEIPDQSDRWRIQVRHPLENRRWQGLIPLVRFEADVRQLKAAREVSAIRTGTV